MKVMEPQDINAAFEEAYNSGEIDRLMTLYQSDAMMAPSPGKRAVFPYLFAKNVTNLKQKLRNMGYDVLDPVKWYVEQRG